MKNTNTKSTVKSGPKLINHIAFVLDGSGSMNSLVGAVVEQFNKQIENLKKLAAKNKQETRVSVYKFSNTVENMFFDVDVNSVPLLDSSFYVGCNTALLKAVKTAADELVTIPTKYGDHSFLVYVLTDGAENASGYEFSSIANAELISRLEAQKDFSFGILVPNDTCKRDAIRFGFAEKNIQIWETTKAGLEKASAAISSSTDSYYLGRSAGIKVSKSLFQPNTNFSVSDAKKSLDELMPNDYYIFPVSKKIAVKPFVEQWMPTEGYRVGSAYYQLTKPEKIQHHKQVILQEKLSGRLYAGDKSRQLLALPNYEVLVDPATHSKFNIFVQSTSINRNLVPGTNLIVIK